MRFKSRLVWETVGVAILSAFPLYIFANVTVEGQVSQSNITSKYTSQCTSNYSYALYEGQSFVSSNIHTPTTLLSSWEYFPQTNIKTYNPYNVFGDQPTQNSLG
ncbi:hypothetical protein KKH82_05670 [Patescibacteria group bacterium]|nr:hypothetical protein [Patescibacteria group bacterium]